MLSPSRSAPVRHQENANCIAQPQIRTTRYINHNSSDASVLPKEMIQTEFNILLSSQLVPETPVSP